MCACTLIIQFNTCSAQQNNETFRLAEAAFYRADYDSALYYYRLEKSRRSLEDRSEIDYRIGEILWRKGNYQEGYELSNEALRNTDDPYWGRKLSVLKSNILFSMGEQQSSVDLIDSIVADIEDDRLMVRALNTRAKSQIWVGDLSGAIESNAQAEKLYSGLPEEDYLLFANLKNVSGILEYYQGNFDNAIREFELSMESKKKKLDSKHPDVTLLYGNIGVMYRNKAEFDKALQYYTFELENLYSTLGEDHLRVATSLLNVGIVLYSKGNYGEAIQAFEKSLAIREKKLGTNNTNTLDLNEWLGIVYARMKDYRRSEGYFQKVLRGREKILGSDNHYVSLTYHNLAELYFLEERYEEALEFFEISAEIGERAYVERNHNQALNWNGVGGSLIELGRVEESRPHFFRSLEISIPGYQWDGDETKPPQIPGYLRFDALFNALMGLADSFRKSDSPEEVRIALKFIKTAEELLHDLQNSFTNDGDRVTIAVNSKVLANVAISAHHKLFESSGDRKHLQQIFRFSELAKSSVLLTRLEDSKAKLISDIPDSLLARERQYRLVKDSLKTVIIASMKTDDDFTGLQGELFEVNRKHDQLISRLEENYPEYAIRKFGSQPVSIQDLQVQLKSQKEQTRLLQYHYADDQLYVTIVGASDHHFVAIENDMLSQMVLNLRSAIVSHELDSFKQYSSELYQAIFQPLEEAIEEATDLIIVPDGILGYIPFDVLLTQQSEESRYNKLPYLVQDFTISYDFSATLFTRRSSTIDDGKNEFLAFAPEFTGTENVASIGGLVLRGDDLEPLAGAYQESVAISDQLDGELRSGSVASESEFKQLASGYKIIHLATHSIINEDNPDYSKLIFSRSDGDDGQLHAFELQNMDLGADLVTLSACSTGFGRIKEGEGVMSLARAFRAAGVSSVVMSLWPASDEHTADLMQRFYGGLAKGMTKNEALHFAKTSYLEAADPLAANPFHWSSFVLIGDTQPVMAGKDNWMIILLVVVVGVVFIIVGARALKIVK